MARKALVVVALAALVLASGLGSRASAGVTYNRLAEWTTAFTHGSSAGNPADGRWLYEYVSTGDGLAGGDPWWDNPGTLCVWDDDWYGQGGVWARGDNVNPPIPPNRLTHNVGGGNDPYKPRVSWISPADGIVDVSGLMSATWGGGASTDLEVAIAKKAGAGGYTLLASGTVKQAGPTTLDLTSDPALQSVHVSAGDSIVWTTRGTSAGAGWVPLYDQAMNLTLDRGAYGDLLGHWTFDDVADIGRDSSGLGNHGNVNNGPTSSTDVPAAIGSGRSLAFDGQNDHVLVPTINGDIKAFTVGFWLNPASRSDWNQTIEAGGWDRFVFHTTNDGAIYTGVVQGGNWGSRFTPSQLPANTLELNQWQHFLLTYDHGTASFYKDGERLATKTGMDIPSDWARLSIGTGGSNTLHGLADDVAVWDGPLSAEAAEAIGKGRISPSNRQATAALNATDYGPRGKLLGYWTFDDPDDIGRDSSPLGNHGNVNNGPTSSTDVPAAIGSGHSLAFDGQNDHVAVPTLSGDIKAFSVGFWLNPTSRANWNQQVTGGGWDTFVFHTTSDGSVYTGVVQGGNWGSRFTPSQLPADTVQLNTWQHFLFTYDHGTASFYKDGVRLATKTGMDIPSDWTGFNIGLNNGNTIHGLADDVAVWDGPLSAKAAQAIGRGWISPADAYATTVLNDSPIAYWRLDDAPGSTVARDIAGPHDGVFSGSVALGRPGGIDTDPGNTAVEFSGGNMRAASLQGLRDNFSVEWWMNPDTHVNYNQGVGGDGGWAQFLFHTGNNGEVWVGTGCCGGDRRFHSGDLPAGTLELGAWQHLVFTFDEINASQGLARFYMDGELLAERELLKGGAWTAFNLLGSLDGLVDEVAVYDYALSSAQVRAHYAAAIPEPTTLALLALGGLGLLGTRRRRLAA